MKKIEVPYELPEGWQWSRLCNVIELISERDLEPNKYSDISNEGIPYIIGASNFNKGMVTTKRTTLFPSVLSIQGDILISVKGTIGELAINPFETSHIARQVMAIRTFKIKKQFIIYYLESIVDNLNSSAQSMIPGISRNVLQNALIPIAPISEQLRLLDKTEELLKRNMGIKHNQQSLKQLSEQLKKKVLDTAMRGKLVAQDPSDEPASVLLEKIREEKQKLYEEGKLKKKDLQETVIFKGDDNSYYEKTGNKTQKVEVPYPIPNKWAWTRIQDIVTMNKGGGTPSKSTTEFRDGNIPWASVKDLHSGYLKNTIDSISKSGLENSSSNVIPKGNLIIATRMSLGKITTNLIDVSINQDLRGLFITNSSLQSYFKSIYPELDFISTGTTVKGISLHEINKKLIPIPPAKEMHTINKLIKYINFNIEESF